MLSRHAQSLYWIGRYLERAGHLCRLLRLQSEALVDRPVREIHFGWNRIYANVRREPPGGDIEQFGEEEFALADSFALADDLTFERSNPSSVYTCFALGRENARDTRHSISPEVWTSLNTSFHQMQQQDMVSVWQGEPRTFYEGTGSQINTLSGLTDSTMYHDEGWSFLSWAATSSAPRESPPCCCRRLTSAASKMAANSTRPTGPPCSEYSMPWRYITASTRPT